MITIYKCPKCGNKDLTYKESSMEGDSSKDNMAKTVLAGSTRAYIKERLTSNESVPSEAYCPTCDYTWASSKLRTEKADPGRALKITAALMFLSAMFFLSGLLLFVFSILLGLASLACSAIIYLILHFMSKRKNDG